ncbi:MAG: cation:proton antiporter [Deltaproteobacteria bacterium]|nr:cation:proton antiporter [Deltaproteobacteria bacterium]
MTDAIYIIAAVLVAGIGCQWLAWRLRIPAILILLLVGIIAGPLLGWLDPDMLFGDLLFPFVSLSVALILFEGGLTLEFHQIRGLRRVIRRLISVGALATWLLITLATRLFFGLGWDICLLFGALTVVTGPTVIVPMLRSIRPNASIAHILRWEGILIDPIGAILAVLVYEVILAGVEASIYHTMLTLVKMVLVGLTLGLAAGQLTGGLIRRHWLPDYLHNVFTLSLVCGVFAVADLMQGESGLLAVTVMGMRLANIRDVDTDQLVNFKESISVLLISLLFIVLAARLQPDALVQLGWAGVGILVAVQFVARPISVTLATVGTNLSLRERQLLAWIAPRGIVAAAVSSLFALRLEQVGHPEAGFLVPLTFLVIIGTVVLQGLTSAPLARALGVAEAVPKGILVVGAGPVSRALAKVLLDCGFRPQLVDDNRDNIRQSRMEGLNTYYGNPLSDHADRYIDLIGVGAMLALTPNAELNTLAVLHYRLELGRDLVYAVRTEYEKETNARRKTSIRQRPRLLFSANITYAKLASLLSQDWEFRSTELTESFGWEDYLETWGDRALPLMAISPKGQLHPFADGSTASPEADWQVISIVKDKKKPIFENR